MSGEPTETARDVEVNVKFLLRNAMAATALATGLRAGPAAEALIDEIWRDLIAPENIHWRRELGRLPSPPAVKG